MSLSLESPSERSSVWEKRRARDPGPVDIRLTSPVVESPDLRCCGGHLIATLVTTSHGLVAEVVTLLNARQVAAWLRDSEDAARRTVPCVRLGRRVWFVREDLEHRYGPYRPPRRRKP
jgi:hypothetical protein